MLSSGKNKQQQQKTNKTTKTKQNNDDLNYYDKTLYIPNGHLNPKKPQIH